LNRVITGDALAALRTLESEIAYTCITSPPYYGLRDYGIEGQIGLEETVGEYIDKLVLVFREVRRVLSRDGTLWLNVGDSYATRSGPQAPANTRNRHGHTSNRVPDGYKYKELMGIPWLLAFALRGDGWYLRDDIIWHKTNAMPEAVTDRPTRAHEYLFLLSKAPRYYYDAKAIEEPCGSKGNARSFRGGGAYTGHASFDNDAAAVRATHGNAENRSGMRNKRDVWSVATVGFQEAHYATFPPELVRPCVLAGCPRGGTVIDPFFGSGTTGVVALQEERDFIGIDLNPEYTALSKKRIQTVEDRGIQLKIQPMGTAAGYKISFSCGKKRHGIS
jgi:DNA modification methylase